MGYQSKTRLLFRGTPNEIEELRRTMQARADLVNIGSVDTYRKPEIYWSNILACAEEHNAGQDSVMVSDSSWFKAYGEWDQVVDEVRALCSDIGIDYSYARIGEQEDDYESDSSTNEGYICLERSFDMPHIYAEVMDRADDAS